MKKVTSIVMMAILAVCMAGCSSPSDSAASSSSVASSSLASNAIDYQALANWTANAKEKGATMAALVSSSVDSLETGDWQTCVSNEKEMAALVEGIEGAKDVPPLLAKAQTLLVKKARLTDSALATLAAAALSDDQTERGALVVSATDTITQITDVTNEMTEEIKSLPLNQ